MYASKTPEQAGFKPLPYRFYSSGIATGTPAGSHTYHDPENRFHGKQHNPTNPILLDFRESAQESDFEGMGIEAAAWLDVICSRDGDAFLALTPREYGRVTSDHIDHARRVLTRLARLAAS